MNNLLDNIWVINLDRSKERFNNIKNNIESFGLKFNRFSAICGKEIDIQEMDISFLCKTVLCNYGLIGCSLSHKMLWKQLLESGQNAYVVLEDDVIITEKTINILKKIPKYLEYYNIDFLNMNSFDIFKSFHKKVFEIDDIEFVKPILNLSTRTYIITRNGARKLLDLLTNIYTHIDAEISLSGIFGRINCISSREPLTLTTEYTHISTIGKQGKKSFILCILKFFRLYDIYWFLNSPIYTLFLKYEVCLLLLIIIILLCLNIIFIKNKYLMLVLILELIFYLYSF